MLKKIINFFTNKTSGENPLLENEIQKTDVNSIPENSLPQEESEQIKKEAPAYYKNTKSYKEYCLENTGNPHLLKASDIRMIDKDGSTETFKVSGDALVFHKEEKPLQIESEYFVKYVQQEYNPISKIMKNAYYY
ncbi:hypothetical protein QWZ06_22330 [Chryseobacterium tructae]|uniref:Uncharacterized protein n=1 Tax=Chryseobacterium tructae TaxID=1037380 RepID=A0ABV7Y2S1_9FLAO|nr:hypothetical protein [Chryseobacterium tructae]MDN3694796.1 hypothetical protein [Chryseobacterium tructae]